jgi:hypothetical protein
MPEMSELLYHSAPPIRHWPMPRLVWEAARERLRPLLEQGLVPLVLGGDCSIIVGVAQALADVVDPQVVHVLYLDGHIDAEAPCADACVGAGAMGLGIATAPSPFWPGPILSPSAITAIGCIRQIHPQIPHITLAEVRQLGAALTDPAPRPTHRRADWLAALPARLWTGAGARLASALVAIGFFELTALQHERYLFTVFAMPVTVRGLQGGGPSFVVYAHDELPQSRVCDPLLSLAGGRCVAKWC